MTAKELNEKTIGLAPAWMVAEYNELVSIAKSEEWDSCPESLYDWIGWVDGQDWCNTNKFKNAVKKIDKQLGILTQIKEGEEVVTMNGRMRVGQWRYEKSYEQLIDA